jgi:aldehyde dehydrogenase (NAD+)
MRRLTIEALEVGAFGFTTSRTDLHKTRTVTEAGMVMVNLPTAGIDYHVPFGGRKGSSYGPREQGRYAAEFYTAVKTAYAFDLSEPYAAKAKSDK